MNLYYLYFIRPEWNQKEFYGLFFFFKEIILWKRSMLFQTHHYPLESHNLFI